MDTIKKIFGILPTGAWIVIGLFVLVGLFWFSDDVGSWWEGRKQAQFDAKIAEKQVEIDQLIKQRDEAVRNAEQAEAREQAKMIEADLLRQEAAKRGVNIAEAQKKIEAATKDYQNDLEFIEKVKTGEVTNIQLCQKQCADSAELGYPCRPNYCERFQ